MRIHGVSLQYHANTCALHWSWPAHYLGASPSVPRYFRITPSVNRVPVAPMKNQKPRTHLPRLYAIAFGVLPSSTRPPPRMASNTAPIQGMYHAPHGPLDVPLVALCISPPTTKHVTRSVYSGLMMASSSSSSSPSVGWPLLRMYACIGLGRM